MNRAFLIPFGGDIFNRHRNRVRLQLHLEVEDRFLRSQTMGQCLGEIVSWHVFGVIRSSGAICLARNS